MILIGIGSEFLPKSYEKSSLSETLKMRERHCIEKKP